MLQQTRVAAVLDYYRRFLEAAPAVADLAAMPEDQLMLKANQWELEHGGLSGRTAQQFIDYLLGCSEEEAQA